MKPENLKLSGVLFILAGAGWFVAAALGGHTWFYILAVAFAGLGAAFIGKAKRAGGD